MVLDFRYSLKESQKAIGFKEDVAEFIIFDSQKLLVPEVIDAKFSKALWTVVELLNKRYANKLDSEFNLYNWIENNPKDEVAYFLNEASSNCMNYAEFKAVFKIKVYFGEKGFTIGITQQGESFCAQEIHEMDVKSNEGAGFTFYEECSSKIFFDDAQKTRTVYFEYLIK